MGRCPGVWAAKRGHTCGCLGACVRTAKVGFVVWESGKFGDRVVRPKCAEQRRVGFANMHHDGVAKRDLSWAWMGRVARTMPTREVVGCTMQANRAGVGVGYPGLRFASPRAHNVGRSAAKGTRPSDEASLEPCHPEETMPVCTPTISELASAIVVHARGACEGSTKRVGFANMHLFMKAGTASRSATCRGRGGDGLRERGSRAKLLDARSTEVEQVLWGVLREVQLRCYLPLLNSTASRLKRRNLAVAARAGTR